MKPSLPRVVILELNTPGNMVTQVSELPTFPKEFAKLAEDQTLQNDDLISDLGRLIDPSRSREERKQVTMNSRPRDCQLNQ